MAESKVIQKLVDKLKEQIDFGLEEKAKFLKTFETNPLAALKWSENLFETTTDLQLAQEVLKMLDKGTALEEIVAQFNEDVLRHAKHPPSSTLQTGNLLDIFIAKAKADMLNLIERLVSQYSEVA